MKTEGKTGLGRRQFLRVMGVGVAATAAPPVATEALADGVTNDEKRKSLYRETASVKAFYRVNSYPSAK